MNLYVKKNEWAGKFLLRRKINYKCRTSAESRANRNFTTVKSCKVFDDGKTEARTANIAGAAAVSAIESFENS